MFLSALAKAWNEYRRIRAERAARAMLNAISVDEVRRAGIMTTLGGSFTLPFGR
ncbi:MAG: hypothetical protein JNK84_08550 [Phreatobacter sp.]|uniref:hypothetical protein n=1 Tax=Phreatobacter sp. TaxID=1966341 RepID=UPI001A50652E|nr:hypothetical protein [Phreatobacter sp.]MBL8569121.1 hypothetical protein [Phreatobacter sp.]